VAAGGLTGLAGVALAGKPGGGSTRNQLFIPSIIKSQGTDLAAELTAAPGQVNLGGGRMSQAWVYNGLMPGPTLLAHKGDRATIALHNALPQQTITHWHGMLASHENDGHPMMKISPGETYNYDFPIINRAALNWYHLHPHMLTGEQVAMGLVERSSSATPRRTAGLSEARTRCPGPPRYRSRQCREHRLQAVRRLLGTYPFPTGRATHTSRLRQRSIVPCVREPTPESSDSRCRVEPRSS
jgi:hypothetical protein